MFREASNSDGLLDVIILHEQRALEVFQFLSALTLTGYAECGDIDHLIDEQLLKVQARLKSMRALERQLTELRRRCDAHHVVGECGILHELVAAAHGEACACHGDALATTGGKQK